VNGNTRPKNLLIALALVLLASLPWMGSRLGFGRDAAATSPASNRPTVDLEGDAPPPPARRARVERPGAAPGSRIASLHLADLERAPRQLTPGRDPWRFVDPPPQSAQPSHAKPKAPAAEPGPAAIGTDPSPHPRDFPLSYLGHFGPPGKPLAVFANGQAVFNQQEGDVIDNQFIVTHIGYEFVDIRFVGFPDAPAKRIGVTSRRPGGARGNPG
jgi:hypothetical protein